MKSRRGGEAAAAAAEYMATPQVPPPCTQAAMIPRLPAQSGTERPLPGAALAGEHFRDSMAPLATAASRPSNGGRRALQLRHGEPGPARRRRRAAGARGLVLRTAGGEAAAAALTASRSVGAAGAPRRPPAAAAGGAVAGQSSRLGLVPRPSRVTPARAPRGGGSSGRNFCRSFPLLALALPTLTSKGLAQRGLNGPSGKSQESEKGLGWKGP